MTPPIHLIHKDGEKTPEQLLKWRDEHGVGGTLHAVDFYVEGAESWMAVPGGWRHESGRIVNVDHHAPHPSMQRHVSSANLALALVEAGGLPAVTDAVVISHIDCDSILSAGLLAGRLEPKPEYAAAAVAADHTGVENEIADLLQGLDAHWSRSKEGPPTLDTVEYIFECLASHEAGQPLPDAMDGFAQEALDKRRGSRRLAASIAGERMQRKGRVHWALLTESEGPVEGELFLPHLPEAVLVATVSPHADHAERWRWRIRLGPAAPSWLSLHDLGINEFDPVYGGRWNGGSNNRPPAGDGEDSLPGSRLPPAEYVRRLAVSLDARLLERAIEIAVEAHRGQRDKAGAPYILHPLRVMAACSSMDAKIVGVLHDVVEDGHEWTLDRLRTEGFGPEIVAGVEAVTKRSEEKSDPESSDGENDQRYFAFCRRAAAHPIGREVKLADLRDNLDESRLPEVTEKDRRRWVRYRRGLAVVEGKVEAGARRQ